VEYAQQQSKDDIDLAPFQQLFSATLTDLRSLKDQVNGKITSLIRDVRDKDRQRKEELQSAKSSLAQIEGNYTALYDQVIRVGVTAIRNGACPALRQTYVTGV